MRDFDELRFNLERSVRYHDKRRGYFEFLGKLLQFVALAGSSAAVLALLNKLDSNVAAVVFSAVAAGASLLNLIIGCPAKHELYTRLKNQYVDLIYEMSLCIAPTAADVQRFRRDRAKIEKEEPTISFWLNVICYNETIDALGYDASNKRPEKWFYFLGNWRLT